MRTRKVAIVGTVGVPACYGGFETLVENIIKNNQSLNIPYEITVYCSGKEYNNKISDYCGAQYKIYSIIGQWYAKYSLRYLVIN